jgi:hypothetical protein
MTSMYALIAPQLQVTQQTYEELYVRHTFGPIPQGQSQPPRFAAAICFWLKQGKTVSQVLTTVTSCVRHETADVCEFLSLTWASNFRTR